MNKSTIGFFFFRNFFLFVGILAPKIYQKTALRTFPFFFFRLTKTNERGEYFVADKKQKKKNGKDGITNLDKF